MNNIKLMYITNRPEVAVIAEKNGVDRIFVDMEYIGKDLRQGGMDTVQSRHTIEDIIALRSVVEKSELLVRCNPIHESTEQYCSTQKEIDKIVSAGADIIMLPFFKTVQEVKTFINAVGGRTRTMLLFETPDSYKNADDILEIDGIDEVYIGLNDMSLGFGKKFMFELLVDGTVETLCQKFRKKGYPFGFGGIAVPGGNVPLPAERIIKEHYRLGSSCVILSRSFCNADKTPCQELDNCFRDGVNKLRAEETICKNHPELIMSNQVEVTEIIKAILGAN